MEGLFGVIYLIVKLIREAIQVAKADEYARRHAKRH